MKNEECRIKNISRCVVNKRNLMLFHLPVTYILHSTFLILHLQTLFFQA